MLDTMHRAESSKSGDVEKADTGTSSEFPSTGAGSLVKIGRQSFFSFFVWFGAPEPQTVLKIQRKEPGPTILLGANGVIFPSRDPDLDIHGENE